MSSSSLLCLLLVVAASLAPMPTRVLSAVSYSPWATTVFPDLVGYSAPSASASSSGSTTTVQLNGAVTGAGTGGTPFSSVYNVTATVSASANLAYPFTGSSLNAHLYQDYNTGIDVMAGGVITFHMPSAGTGTWCFELGRSLAGQQACTGPAGFYFDYFDYPCAPASAASSPCGQEKCNNSMINGAWNSSLTVPADLLGTSLSFTYARSGALMARIGASGGNVQLNNTNPNDPVDEYFSAFDYASACPAVITLPSTTTGAVNSYTAVNSGRLYLAIFRWNFFPGLASGSVNILIDYVSPLQLAVSSPSINGSAVGSVSHPLVLNQTYLASSSSVSLATGSGSSVTVTGLLPVVNITGLTLNPSTASSSAFYNCTLFTYQGPVNQVSQGGAFGQNQSTGQPWLSAFLQPQVALSNSFGATSTVGVDMSSLLSSNAYGFLFPATVSGMNLDPWLQQYYPPCNNDYDCDYDTGINVIEGGSITLSASASQIWCVAAGWNPNGASSCSNAQGNSSWIWEGCSGQFSPLLSNASSYAWNSTNGNNDNSGCNSDSTLQAPMGAVAFRIGVDTTAMKNAGFYSVEYHSFDYYYAFPNAAVNGVLSNTFSAPNTGRLYLAMQGPGGSQSLYSGSITVSASYTPPPNLVLGLTWSPSSVQQPYLFAAPTSSSTAALAAAGLVPASAPRYLPIPDTLTSTVTVQFWVYQQLLNNTASASSSASAVTVSTAVLAMATAAAIALLSLSL